MQYLPVAVQFQDALLMHTHYSIHTCTPICIRCRCTCASTDGKCFHPVSSINRVPRVLSHFPPTLQAKDPTISQELRAEREGLSASLRLLRESSWFSLPKALQPPRRQKAQMGSFVLSGGDPWSNSLI